MPSDKSGKGLVPILPGKILPERYISGASISPYSFGSRQEGFLNNLNQNDYLKMNLSQFCG